jgi:hypothetical protein
MFAWHALPDEQRQNILSEISNTTGYPTNIIEKDWWVTVALKAVKEIDFIPPDTVLEYWREDYNTMLQTIIYGQAPDFDQLIEGLKVLRNRFRT